MSSSSSMGPRDPKPPRSPSSTRQKGGLRSTYVFTTRPPSSQGQSIPDAPLPVYPTLFKQPFPDPLEVLCHAYNVKKLTIAIKAKVDVPERVTMSVLHDAHTPTHALAILDTPRAAESKEAQSILYPIIVPIDAEDFEKAFNNEIIRHFTRQTQTVTNSPVFPPSPTWSREKGEQVVTLPTITTRVPHPPSIPLLVLFGLAPYLPLERMGDAATTPVSPSPSPSFLTADFCPSSFPGRNRTSPFVRSSHLSTGLLTTYLLPIAVIEEFPAAAAMAEVMAQTCSDEELAAYVVQNQGLWRNALSLAPQDSAIIEIVRTAWNVTAEARRLRDKMREVEVQHIQQQRRPS